MPTLFFGSLLAYKQILIKKGGENMHCEHRGHHEGGRHGRQRHAGSCGCGDPSHFGRRFWTREEKITRLEKYLDDLRQEAKSVEERIAEIKDE